MIKGGAEVKVLDNRTKEDLTSVTLAQIIFEEEKKRSQMPLGVLREIIRHGGEAVAVFYQDKVGSKLSERLEEMKSRTDALRENIEQRVRGVTSLLRGSEDKGSSPVKEVLVAGQTAVEELRAKVDQSVKQALDSFGTGAMAQELEKLQRKIEALEKKVKQFGKSPLWRMRSSRSTAGTCGASTRWRPASANRRSCASRPRGTHRTSSSGTRAGSSCASTWPTRAAGRRSRCTAPGPTSRRGARCGWARSRSCSSRETGRS